MSHENDSMTSIRPGNEGNKEQIQFSRNAIALMASIMVLCRIQMTSCDFISFVNGWLLWLGSQPMGNKGREKI